MSACHLPATSSLCRKPAENTESTPWMSFWLQAHLPPDNLPPCHHTYFEIRKKNVALYHMHTALRYMLYNSEFNLQFLSKTMLSWLPHLRVGSSLSYSYSLYRSQLIRPPMRRRARPVVAVKSRTLFVSNFKRSATRRWRRSTSAKGVWWKFWR